MRPDSELFEDLYRRHRPDVYRFLLRDLRSREDAEDATQTAFLQAYRAYERGSRPDRPRAWLITIADNLRRRRFRTDRRAEELPLDESLIEATSQDELVHELRDALEALPFNQRAALVLREVAGLSYGEIARHLSVSVGSVQMLIFRARRSLREELAPASRGAAVLFAPGWLSNLLSGSERVAAQLRFAAAAAVTAVATVSVTGAGPAPRSAPVVESPRPAARTGVRVDARAPGVVAPAHRRTRRAPRPAPSTTIAPPTPATPPAAGTPAAEAPAARVAPVRILPQLPELQVPATPKLPALPSVPAVPVPAPALPLPPLPLDVPQELEGALDPQLDAVLAGR